jgi:S1-C subfamily serine protease
MSIDPARVDQQMRSRAWALCVVLCMALDRETACATAPLVAEATSLYACGLTASVASSEPAARTAAWPFFNRRSRPVYDACPVTPHPAVARIIVPEHGATAFGSGTLVDVRDQYGLVVTNWHVVRDSQGVVEVAFPNGFRSHARPLKVDSDWDLAALVIWRPAIEPVTLAAQPARAGDLLTIHGYGQGQYRIATGRCTAYYAPRLSFPQEMLELDVEARQGDSGGPIFNQRGELAGVLFGAGQGTTLGSFAPRVSNFLATLAPDIGEVKDGPKIAVADRPAPNVRQTADGWSSANAKYPSSAWTSPECPPVNSEGGHSQETSKAVQLSAVSTPPDKCAGESLSSGAFSKSNRYELLKSALAIVGLLAIGVKLVKAVG